MSALMDITKIIQRNNNKILSHVNSATLNALLAMENISIIACLVVIPMLKAVKVCANV